LVCSRGKRPKDQTIYKQTLELVSCLFLIQVERERKLEERKKRWTKIKAKIKFNVNFD
jgi:hypothetical protein